MKHEDGFERRRGAGSGSEHHGGGGNLGSVPGKRAPSGHHAAADPTTAILRGLAAVEDGLDAIGARHLPAVKSAVDARAAAALSAALARVGGQLESLRRWALVTGSEGAMSLITPLVEALDAYRAEAVPVLARAPAPSPEVPVAAAFDPLSSEWDEVLTPPAPVQLRARGPVATRVQAHAHAAAGVTGTGGALPHLDAIQASFGPHDVGSIRAHVGGAAATASDAIGAEAYATGNDVAFASSPTLFVAAHEAAHVVQQRAGVSLLGGVGEAGDRYEQHADEVADKVVRGESAAELLGEAGRASLGEPIIQRFDLAGAFDVDADSMEAAKVEADRRAAIKNEPLEVTLQRFFLISDIAALCALMVGLQADGVRNAVKRLENTSADKASGLSLIDLSASAAIGGMAGVVATTIADGLVRDLSSELAKGVGDAIKDGIKYALKTGTAATRVPGNRTLLEEFGEAQTFKVSAAKAKITHSLWTEKASDLYFLELKDLSAIAENAALMAQNEAITNEQERVTSVEWINFVARAHHGTGAWEASSGAPKIATGAALAASGEEAENAVSQRNVADNGSAVDLVFDESQRKFQDEHHGLLEISLGVETLGHLTDEEIPEFWLYEHRGYGIRMDGVNTDAKEQLQKSGSVAAARVNKIVRLYWDFDLSPPKPQHAILVTADGFIRAESVHETVPSSVTLAAVRYADALSLKHLK